MKSTQSHSEEKDTVQYPDSNKPVEGTFSVVRRSTSQERNPDGYKDAVVIIMSSKPENPQSFFEARSGKESAICDNSMDAKHDSII